MEKNTVESLYRSQKKKKPKIDEIIETSLTGENKARAQAFVGFVRSLRMSPQWASANSWAVSFKGKRVCYIKIPGGTPPESAWYIRPAVEYCDELAAFCQAERLEGTMLDNAHYCRGCGSCARGKRLYFLDANWIMCAALPSILNSITRTPQHWNARKSLSCLNGSKFSGTMDPLCESAS